MTQEEITETLSQVKHPAIDISLIELGIATDIELVDKTVLVTFAFPFPNIPIADKLINSIKHPLQENGLELEYIVRIMNETERSKFLELEHSA
jgi:metal-sulfur cluster biosynthetic enzyme